MEKLPMSIELRISSSPFLKSSSVLVYSTPVCVWVYSRVGGPFCYPAWCNIQLFCDWNTLDVWPYFLGTKVGNINLYSSFFIIWWL